MAEAGEFEEEGEYEEEYEEYEYEEEEEEGQRSAFLDCLPLSLFALAASRHAEAYNRSRDFLSYGPIYLKHVAFKDVRTNFPFTLAQEQMRV